MALGSVLSGLVQSLGTEWGLFKHYWIAVKILLTILATILLLVHMQLIVFAANLATQTTVSAEDFRGLRTQLVVDATAALVVLLGATALSVFRPWGKTPLGRRDTAPQLDRSPAFSTSFGFYVLLGISGLFLVLAVLHLVSGGMRRH